MLLKACVHIAILQVVLSVAAANSAGEEDCPPWLFLDNSSNCICRQDLHQEIKCDQKSQKSFLKVGYCMNYDSEDGDVYLGDCSFLTSPVTADRQLQNVVELNAAICGKINRKGMLCGECNNEFGVGLYTYGFQCVRCKDNFPHWISYLFMELFPLTIFMMVIIFFRINTVTPPMNAFVLYCHLFVIAVELNTPLRTLLLHDKHSVSYIVTQTLLLLCGIWTLDFLHFIIPPFCVSPSIKNIHALMFRYIAAFYPLCLIVVGWTCIHLHDRNFRLAVWLWKPFHKCFARCRRRWNPKASTIDVFVTFLHLSYSRLAYVSLLLLGPTKIYDISEVSDNVSLVLESDPSVKYFGEEHLPFAAAAIIILLAFVVFPSVLLCLYPTRPFRRCSARWRFQCSIALNTFVEKFHGCYKDGTNDTKDYRFISGLHLAERFLLFILYTVLFIISGQSVKTIWSWMTFAVTLIIAAMFVALVRPYKNNRMNVLESLLLVLLAMTSMIFNNITMVEDGNLRENVAVLLTSTILLLVAIPQIIFTSYIVYRLLKFTQSFKPPGSNFRNQMQHNPLTSEADGNENDEHSNVTNEDEEATERMSNADMYTPLMASVDFSVKYTV